MIVEWKKDHLLSASIPRLDAQGNSLPSVEMVTLHPGFNELPDAIWKALQPSWQSKIEQGLLVADHVFSAKEDDKEVTSGKSLSSIEVSKAVAIVKNTWDIKTLDTWLNGVGGKGKEKRDEVRLEIKEQKDRIINYAPPKKVNL